MSNNMPMLCKLLEHGAELDWYALRYVLEQGHMLPTAHAPVEHLLTNYVRTRRNPANTTYAIALCLHTVAKEHTSKVRPTLPCSRSTLANSQCCEPVLGCHSSGSRAH